MYTNVSCKGTHMIVVWGGGGGEKEEEDLFVFHDTIEGPRAPDTW